MMNLVNDDPVLWVNVRTLETTDGRGATRTCRRGTTSSILAAQRYPNLKIYDWASAAQIALVLEPTASTTRQTATANEATSSPTPSPPPTPSNRTCLTRPEAGAMAITDLVVSVADRLVTRGGTWPCRGGRIWR